MAAALVLVDGSILEEIVDTGGLPSAHVLLTKRLDMLIDVCVCLEMMRQRLCFISSVQSPSSEALPRGEQPPRAP